MFPLKSFDIAQTFSFQCNEFSSVGFITTSSVQWHLLDFGFNSQNTVEAERQEFVITTKSIYRK